MLANVRQLGDFLAEMLRLRVGNHPNVGDIRGRGFFWGIEFVADKTTGAPFPVDEGVAMAVAELGLTDRYNMGVYPGTGTVDGVNGDHIIISPPYNVTKEEVVYLVETVCRLINDYFSAKTGSVGRSRTRL